MTTEAFAPAKINLTLHVTGRRADGYHLLDSLVMLVDVGDRLTFRKSKTTRLHLTGPMGAGVPTGAENLVLRAAALMGLSAEIDLEKHLPSAAGIGGGSSDAAACLRGLSRLYNVPLPGPDRQLELGADVPVCMQRDLSRMRGIGEDLTVLGPAPNWPMILVNPMQAVSTGAVFSQLADAGNAPMPDDFPLLADWGPQIDWLARQRNDLEEPAQALLPEIADVLQALRAQDGCLFARMSGSGATSFAILRDDDARDAAMARLRRDHPDWWVMPAEKCGGAFS